MALHMALELPLLFAIGLTAAHAAGPRLSHSLARWDPNGLVALLAASLVGAYWMLPVALDRAVLEPALGFAKAASLVGAGLLLGASWRRVSLVLQVSFVLNAVGMLFVAGMLYHEAPEQLCSVYLAGEQALAGAAMVVWASMLLVGGFVALLRHPALRDRDDSHELNRPCHVGGVTAATLACAAARSARHAGHAHHHPEDQGYNRKCGDACGPDGDQPADAAQPQAARSRLHGHQ